MENLRASELRIGNYVQLNTNITQVDVIDYNQIIATEFGLIELKYIKPIPLTEEWLLKFGFETDNIEWWNGIISIGIYKDGLFYCPTGKISLRIGKEIQYVHQLQNLYFALTGKELKQK